MPIPQPAHALPSVVPGAAPAPSPGSCTTLYPGKYTLSTAPSLSGDVYMASGVYYFDNVGTLNVGSTLFGGQPPAGETQTSSATPCRASDPVGASGKGVEIILGGNSVITVGNNSTMELFTRSPAANDGSTPGISLYQVPPGTAGWDGTTLAATTDFLNVGNGAHDEGVVHGAIYAPGGSISLFATNAAHAACTGGLDVWNLSMQSSASTSGLIVAISTTPGQRYTTLTATSTGPSGAKTFTTRAVVLIQNDAPRTVQVASWVGDANNI
jgi:hypothetical protein